jgi:hypothetical protein
MVQFSEGAHSGRVCVYVHRSECIRMYVSVCVYTIFFKKRYTATERGLKVIYYFAYLESHRQGKTI